MRIRLNDDQFELFNEIARETKSTVSTTIRDSALLWIAYTSQPLIHTLNSGKFGELMDDMLAKLRDNEDK